MGHETLKSLALVLIVVFLILFVLKPAAAPDILDPASLPRPTMHVYDYVQITQGKDVNFESADVTLRVSKDWIKENKLKQMDITVWHWKGDWIVLESEITSSDSEYVYVRVSVEELGLLAVGVVPKR